MIGTRFVDCGGGAWLLYKVTAGGRLGRCLAEIGPVDWDADEGADGPWRALISGSGGVELRASSRELLFDCLPVVAVALGRV